MLPGDQSMTVWPTEATRDGTPLARPEIHSLSPSAKPPPTKPAKAAEKWETSVRSVPAASGPDRATVDVFMLKIMHEPAPFGPSAVASVFLQLVVRWVNLPGLMPV